MIPQKHESAVVTLTAATVADKQAARKQIAENPLVVCPAALRDAVWRVWARHSHLFPTPLPLAMAVADWTADHGLSEADASALLAAALRPERMARYKFASDLLTDLAEMAAEAIGRRADHPAEKARRQRELLARLDANAPPLGAEVGRG